MIFDNILNIYTTTPINQIPENERGVRYIELTAEQIERYNNWLSNIGGSIPNNWVLTGKGIDYNTILTEKQLNALKQSKKSELDILYQNKINEGYTDATLQITLRCDDHAVTKFHRLDNTANNSGKANLWLFDKNGVKHTFTKQEVKSLMIRYNDYMYNLEEVYNDYQVEIETSTTEQLQGLTFSF